MIEIKTGGFVRDEILQAVRIQIEELDQGFLSSFGDRALELIFDHVIESPWGIFVLAVELDHKQVIGYVFGSTDTSKLYREFLVKRTLTAVIYFLPRMLSLQKIKKAFETLLYPTKQPDQQLPKPELLDLAVRSAYHGTGIAQELFSAFVDECRKRKVRAFKIPTAGSLVRAHRFYEKVGAKRVASVEVHKGHSTLIYVYDIKE